MPHVVHTERAEPRALAAIRATTTRADLGAAIVRLLDTVWAVLRDQGVGTGHNVVTYHGGDGTSLDIEVGVEVLGDLADHDEVRPTTTPSGEVATTAHYGDYSQMAPAYATLEQWCDSHGRRQSGISWEVYGDWAEDPADVRTDIYFLLEP